MAGSDRNVSSNVWELISAMGYIALIQSLMSCFVEKRLGEINYVFRFLYDSDAQISGIFSWHCFCQHIGHFRNAQHSSLQ